MRSWFKFYGQEYLSDPKMLSLSAVEKALWLTLLCLASSSDDEGVIRYIDEEKIMNLTGLTNDEKEANKNFLSKFEKLRMIKIEKDEDQTTIVILNFEKRNSPLSPYERLKNYRERKKIKEVLSNDNEKTLSEIQKNDENLASNDNETLSFDNGDDNDRIDKKRKEINTGGRSYLPLKSPSSLASPEIKESENLDLADGKGQTQSIGSILKEKLKTQPVKKKNGISTSWQDKAFRYAEKLKIDLKDENIKSRWLKVFKQAYEGRNAKNLELAYSYLSDYPRPLSNETKIKFFFWIYERGLPKAKWGFLSLSLLTSCFLGFIFASFVFFSFGRHIKGLVVGSSGSHKNITSFKIRPSNSMPSPTPTKTIEQKICEKFKEDCQVAVAVAKAESGLRCDAVSSTNDHGLFQINAVHFPKFAGKSPYDCDANIEVAYQIYKRQGFYPWTVYRTGSYKRFLKL